MTTTMTRLVCLIVSLLVPISVVSWPAFDAPSRWRSRGELGVDDAVRLLYRFGYIAGGNSSGDPIADPRFLLSSQQSGLHPAMNTPPEAYKTAVRSFQKRYGLTPTGRLDAPTATLLAAPRCGNPDIVSDAPSVVVDDNDDGGENDDGDKNVHDSLPYDHDSYVNSHAYDDYEVYNDEEPINYNTYNFNSQSNRYRRDIRRALDQSKSVNISSRALLQQPMKALRRVKRYLIGDEKMHWRKRKLTWQIRHYPKQLLDRKRTHAVFVHTFNLWSRVVDLDFIEEKNYYRPADIIIKFGALNHGDAIPFDGPGGVLAHAYYPTPDNVYSFSGDAHFDDDEEWNDGPHKEYRNLVSVATHELGHSMGLGHSQVSTSIMYPYYLSTWTAVKLDPDDITGMQKIYGAAKPGKFIPPEPELPDIPPPPDVTTPMPRKDVPNFDYCNISIDAILKIRNLELYVFKGEWQWRVTWSTTVTTWVSYQFRDGPGKITYYWAGLPNYIDYIDTGIERNDAMIYMFRGATFWLMVDNVKMAPNFPADGLPLTELGLPNTLKKVDAIFMWGENQVIYVFAGTIYWRLEERDGRFGRVVQAPEYPRNIADTWQGLPAPIDAAFTGLNGETIFFKDKDYYAFDNIAMRVRPGYPKKAELPIIGCVKG